MDSLLSFDLVGSMGQFRKFYTNSSSLSYSFPPRTAICGILAAFLGREIDTYYSDFTIEKAKIAISLKTPVRKILQTVNYVRTKNMGEIDGSKGPTQVPLEFVVPHIGNREIRYTIYFFHTDQAIVEEIYRLLSRHEYKFPIYLGISECPAWIEDARIYGESDISVIDCPEKAIPIATILPVDRIVEEGLSLSENMRIMKDRIPLDFNPDRKIRRVADVIWDTEGRSIEATVNGCVVRIGGKYIVFLEPGHEDVLFT